MVKAMENKEKKLSYEELENALNALSDQNNQLLAQLDNLKKIANDELKKCNLSNFFKRMDYLFKVVENEDKFSSDFVGDCIEEIQTALTPEESEESES